MDRKKGTNATEQIDDNAIGIVIISKKHGKLICLVDKEDYYTLKLSNFRWHVHFQTRKTKNAFYVQGRFLLDTPTSGERKITKIHQLVMNNKLIDHKNGDTLDNRKENLRMSNNSTNQANSAKRTGTSSKYKGVTWRQDTKKWVAQIVSNYKHKNLGSFDVEEDAARAYNEAATKYFGEFARINKIV